jgi:hypothetical protein
MFSFKNIRYWLLAGWLAAGLTWPASAAPLAVGGTVPAFSAKDQFGKDFKFEPGLRFLILGFDMGASKTANRKLADLGAGWLEKHSAVFVLDIHTMPSVARIFALPKMKHYPQRIVLGDDEKMLAPFPRQPDKITILVLTAEGKIREIRYWDPATTDLDLPASPTSTIPSSDTPTPRQRNDARVGLEQRPKFTLQYFQSEWEHARSGRAPCLRNI